MKSFFRTTLIALLFAISFVSFAQENTKIESSKKASCKYGPYITNNAFDNIFIGAGGGVTYLLNGYNVGNFTNKLFLGIDISLGKWFTPNLGVRLQANGMYAGGYTVGTGLFAKYPTLSSDELSRSSFHVRMLHGDFLLNLSNVISGYREDRFWDFIPFVGFGYAGTSAKDSRVNSFAGYVGLLNTLRVTNWFDFTIEAKYMLAPGTFDGEPYGTNSIDGLAMVTAGVSFNLGNKKFERKSSYVAASEYKAAKDQLNSIKKELQSKQDENAQLANDLNKALEARNNVVTPVAAVSKEIYEFSPVALFFPIGQATLNNKELVNLEFFVKKALEIDPEHMFTLTGMADSSTGTKAHNQALSEKRVNYVKSLLVNKYNIKRNKISTKANGSTNDLFDAPELNRIVIIK